MARPIPAFLLPLAMATCSAPGAATATPQNPAAPPATGIVASIAKAPIAPDGDVAGEKTDLVVTFDTGLDPAVPGRALKAGRSIRIKLPDEFVNLGRRVGLPPLGDGSAAVLLQGWPQNPIPPVAANYDVALEGTHTIVYTAARDLVPGDPTLNGPGIKQAHLILRGFVNPRPGVYVIEVEAETGPGGEIETGSAPVVIRRRPRASINVTSVFAGPSPRPNTIYQETTPMGSLPIPWNFLVWDGAGEPAVGVTIRQLSDRFALLMQNEQSVGWVLIDAPRGAVGQSVSAQGPSTSINGPVLGLPTGRLTANFQAGDVPGIYRVTFAMAGGTSVQMTVTVSD